MWLLSTTRAELKFFAGPENVPGGYAILSHVWLKDSQEDTFQKVQTYAGESRFEVTSEAPTHAALLSRSPRDLVSPKVRGFLALAESDGYKWAWADTCCIDKTSSAELTEAINSMFRYYSLARICYVYLNDVSAVDQQTSDDTTGFAQSKWHRRGWTLQELLASRIVVFLSKEWTPLGTKFEFADLLQDITAVPSEVLRLETNLAVMSVAARMSWASKRETTRIEDAAYCLFGLFGVNLPPLYGEGQNAFYRLQEEILRTSGDVSLFAW
ncbi:heterokaryon incompatibility protein-domain-containing protein, partial [Epithele typhae]|uniref:heterokaryon incompatibility protein-domain-containing protein n=1 Tax=Epithele typhae TaxID=378194 RepID=UPI00200889DF